MADEKFSEFAAATDIENAQFAGLQGGVNKIFPANLVIKRFGIEGEDAISVEDRYFDLQEKTLEVYSESSSNPGSNISFTMNTGNTQGRIPTFVFYVERLGDVNTLQIFPDVTISNKDIDITDFTKGIVLRSPNSNRWRVTIDNSGNLITTQL